MPPLNLNLFKWSLVITALVSLTAFAVDEAFLDKQKTFVRVRSAYAEKQARLTVKLKYLGLDLDNINVLITAFKTEQELNVYVKSPSARSYRKLGSYYICQSSGILGPKRAKGDRQVPEGFYYIERFNPSSTYYLSLGLNYPNAADRMRSGRTDPGSDIFIHGNCVTIGCMPVTDDGIKEIYLLALQAYASGQKQVPVYVFPYKFNSISAERFSAPYQQDKAMLAFWSNLKTGFDKFNANNQELRTSVNRKGEYVFN